MGYAIVLERPVIGKGLIETVIEKNYDFEKLRKDFNQWYEWKEDKKEKLSPIKLYMHFKKHEFCDALYTAEKMGGELERNIKNYIKKANAPKFYSFFFNLKESARRFFRMQTEYSILENELKREAESAYFSHSYLLNEKEERHRIQKKKDFRDLEDREKYYIATQRLKGESCPSLMAKCSLSSRNVVYQVMTEYRREKGLTKKSDKITYGKLTAEQAIEISMLNKELNMSAEAIAELKGLSGKHVVYLCNRYRREREQREKAKEEMQIKTETIKPFEPFEIEQTYMPLLKEQMQYPLSNYLN